MVDYLNQASTLQSFYQHPVSKEGVEAAIKNRRAAKDHRQLLVDELIKQYAAVPASPAVEENIKKLLSENTFTVTTAHQPAIFTGHLYFVYKILHAIKLAEQFKKDFPGNDFVPVFWMGSEDADLDELGHIYLSGEKIVWNTKQTGAVGRMNTKGLDAIVHRISGELSVQPHGKELMKMISACYLESADVQTATFKLIHTLFAEYGLVVVIPDNANLKRIMQPVFEEDLFDHIPSAKVEKTIEQLSENYKVQANPRQVNLFYLTDGVRGLIEPVDGGYEVRDSDIKFSKAEIKEELKNHPERFSPNVILRGVYQEILLPNIAFIGGGGETAYWLEYKDLFDHYKVPFPLLVLRNSFLIVEKKWQEKIQKLGFTSQDFFQSEQELLTSLVSRYKNGELKLKQEMETTTQVYQMLKDKAGAVDKSLLKHVEALQVRTLKPLQELEKKMLRAEKRKYEAEQRHIQQVKTALFPHNGLQERIENFMPYYAKGGAQFIKLIYENSLALEQEFVILEEK
jgi:bacillithiol synthase